MYHLAGPPLFSSTVAMPINPGVTASNIHRASLIGQTDKLLSADAISRPDQHLFGHATGPDRDFLMALFLPDEANLNRHTNAIQQWSPEPEHYAYPGMMAIILSHSGEDLNPNHFNAVKIRAIIVRMGMEAGIMDGLVADVRHAK